MENYKEHVETEEEVSTSCITDTIPRYEKPNPHNYTNLELAEKDKIMRVAEKEYPNQSPKIIELLYDMITKQKTQEEVNEIINKGLWEKKSSIVRPTGGTFKTMEILDPEDLKKPLEIK
jgi:hypothetical protein